MRTVLFFALGLLAPPTTTDAQSLDLVGVELRVGEDSAVAIAKLRSAYDVTYQGVLQSWLVMRKGWKPSDSFVFVASVVVKEGHVSSILKYFDLGDGSDLSTVYSTALRDAQRDQIGPCLMSPGRIQPVVATSNASCSAGFRKPSV